MGSWNGTCAISNLHITAQQRVVVLMLLKNHEERSYCYNNAKYDLCPLPFYGQYDDYGGVENCEGFGLNIVLEAIRSQLYRFGQGPNSSHDCEVTKENLDIDMLFRADQEDRLGIEHHNAFSTDSYHLRSLENMKTEDGLTDAQAYELDRLANKLKKVDTFRQVSHVIIHGDIFEAIMRTWYIEDYVGGGKGNKGYGNNYVHLYFQNLEDSIPEYIEKMKECTAELRAAQEELRADGTSAAVIARFHHSMRSESFDYDDPCLAGRWMNIFDQNPNMEYGLIKVKDLVGDYCDAEDWDGLAAFVKECLTVAWLNSYMMHTRKIWTRQTGAGGQMAEPLGYQVLANAVLGILEAERAEQAEWDAEIVEDDLENETDDAGSTV